MMDTATLEKQETIQLKKAQVARLRYYFVRKHANCARDGTDLDLLGAKLISINTTKWSDYAEITELGIQVLHQHRQADLSARRVHHDLGGRLSEYLRKQGRITWENVEFRNRVKDESINHEYWQCVRPDVFSINPSLEPKYFNPCVHEVKVSRADFMSDMAKPKKHEAYAAMSEAVYYVAPEGIIQPAEMPKGYGLLVERSEGEFVLIKRPRKRKIQLQAHHYLNMIIKPGQYPPGYRGAEELEIATEHAET